MFSSTDIVRVDTTNGPRRVTGDNGIRLNILSNNRVGANDAVLTNGDTLTNEGAIPHLYVVFKDYRCGVAGCKYPMLQIVPISVTDVGVARQHAALTYLDSLC